MVNRVKNNIMRNSWYLVRRGIGFSLIPTAWKFQGILLHAERTTSEKSTINTFLDGWPPERNYSATQFEIGTAVIKIYFIFVCWFLLYCIMQKSPCVQKSPECLQKNPCLSAKQRRQHSEQTCASPSSSLRHLRSATFLILYLNLRLCLSVSIYLSVSVCFCFHQSLILFLSVTVSVSVSPLSRACRCRCTILYTFDGVAAARSFSFPPSLPPSLPTSRSSDHKPALPV